jgi:hypothetical protein
VPLICARINAACVRQIGTTGKSVLIPENLSSADWRSRPCADACRHCEEQGDEAIHSRSIASPFDQIVMPALVAGIHVFYAWPNKTWMAGTSPAMTEK